MVQFPPFGSALDVGLARPCASYAEIPPFGGGEVAVRGGVAPASQITTATNADNGVLWLVVCVVGPCLDSCVARTRTRYCERQPAISHVNPLFRVWARLPTLTSAG